MLETKKGRRKLLAGIATVGLTLGGSAAYAFWTGGEAGGGSALVGSTGGGFVQVSMVGQPNGLTPGGPPKNIKILVTNPDSDENAFVFVYGVKVTVDPTFSLDHDGDPLTEPCKASDFSPTTALMNGPFGANLYGTQSTTLNATISMIDRGLPNPSITDPALDPNNQDACKGAEVPLILTPLYTVPGT